MLGAKPISLKNFISKVKDGVLEKNTKTQQEITISFFCDSEDPIILDFKLIYPGKNKPKIKIIKGKSFVSLIGENTINKKINLFDNSVATFDKGVYELEIIINGICIKKESWIIN